MGNAVGAISQLRRKYDAFSKQAAHGGGGGSHEAKARKELLQRMRQGAKNAPSLQSPAVRKSLGKHKGTGKNTWNSIFPGRNGKREFIS